MLVLNYDIPQKVIEEKFRGTVEQKVAVEYSGFELSINPVNDHFHISFGTNRNKFGYEDMKTKIFINSNLVFDGGEPEIKEHSYGYFSFLFRENIFNYMKWSDVRNIYIDMQYKNYQTKKWEMYAKLHIVNPPKEEDIKNREYSIGKNGIIFRELKGLDMMRMEEIRRFEEKYCELDIRPIIDKEPDLYVNKNDFFRLHFHNLLPYINYSPKFEHYGLKNIPIDNTLKSIPTKYMKDKFCWEINSDIQSRYDYNNKTTTTLSNAEIKDGYILPYSFKGVFSPRLEFSFGHYKNIKIGYDVEVQNSLLGELDSKYTVNIKEENSIKNKDFSWNHYKISSKDFSYILPNQLNYFLLIKKSILNGAVLPWKENVFIIEEKKKD